MTREGQIEALAKAWEALGNMHMANETWLGEDGDHDELVTQFQRGCKVVANFYHYAPGGNFDTDDATPCLAILRDVYGEDWDIARWVAYAGPSPGRHWCAQAPDDTPGIGDPLLSRVSRIHAVTLALEAKK